MLKTTTPQNQLGYSNPKNLSTALANAVYSEIYRKLGRKLIAYAISLCNRSYLTKDKMIAADIVQDAFILFIEKNHFQWEAKDQEDFFKRLESYIGKTMYHLWIKEYKKRQEGNKYVESRKFPIMEEIHLFQSNELDSSIKIVHNNKIFNIDFENISELLSALSNRERDILITYGYHYNLYKLPHAQVTRLSKKWSVTPDNIRTIKMRAIAKIKRLILAEFNEE